MDFTSRTPSAVWESVPVPEAPGQVVWAWFKPAGAPLDVMIHIPPQTHAACGQTLSMRRLMQLVGIGAEFAESWTVQGASYPSQGGTNPLLDSPLPPSSPAEQSALCVRMLAAMPPPAAAPLPIPVMPAGPAPAPVMPTPAHPGDERVFEAFEADWNALLQLETQLGTVRKQLGAIQSQLQSLNRDLSPDERLAADSQDQKDWQEARRWLRESLTNVARWIRDHDIGMVSSAGNRNRFEEVHQQYVVPRRPFPGLADMHQEFELHRKTAQHLLMQMHGAYQKASSDGVARARQVLNRIAAKVRKAKEKRGTRSKKRQ